MIGIYHSRDLDGFASGAIIKLKYPDAVMIGYDYGLPFDLSLVNGKKVIMADVSMPMDIMYDIANRSNWNLTWIDHHISAIKDYNNFVGVGESFCKAVLDNSISACEGTWKYLFPDEPTPKMITLLGEYDTWRNQDKNRWENEILPFQFGMRLFCNSLDNFPDNVFWDNTFIPSVIEKGNVILKYQAKVNEALCKKAAFEFDFEGLKAIVLNGVGFNSDVFKTVYDPQKHDIMMMFQFNGKFWVVSLYTTKDEIDCSVLAKEKGGGGHKKAAGFECHNIINLFPFLENTVKSK